MDPCSIPRTPRTRRPATLRLPRPRARLHPPPISVTLGDLPPGETLRIYQLPAGHCLVVIALRYADQPDRIERAYLNLPADHPARPHIWQMVAVPDPLLDPDGYAAAHWWQALAVIDMAFVLRMETAGLICPWPHGRTAGPLLTPSR